MWLLDANVLRAFQDRRDPAHERVLCHGDIVGWDNVCVPVVVAAELLDALLRYIEEAHRRRSTQLLEGYARFQETYRTLSLLSVVPFTREALEIYRSGVFTGRMSRNDRLIAAIAVAGEHILVTRNLADFRSIPRLQIENWIDEPLP